MRWTGLTRLISGLLFFSIYALLQEGHSEELLISAHVNKYAGTFITSGAKKTFDIMVYWLVYKWILQNQYVQVQRVDRLCMWTVL